MTQIYHVLSRGVDKRKIFLDDQDYFRFIHDLFEFNDKASANTTFYPFSVIKKALNKKEVAEFRQKKKPRKFLVNILAFCMMPNHYHLLLSSAEDGGIPKFMKKLNMGYAKYFNERYERAGALFEGRYKRILIQDHAHLLHLPYYIHLNPLDLCAPEWRDRKLKNYNNAVSFLTNYRWSSHLDYLGKRNFPSVTQREFLEKTFGGAQKYKKEILCWLKDLSTEEIKPVILE